MQVSPAAKQMLKALLQRDPQLRLGALKGATEIKEHEFFEGVEWPLIRGRPIPPLEVPVKLTTPDVETPSLSEVDEELEWDETEAATPAISMDLG